MHQQLFFYFNLFYLGENASWLVREHFSITWKNHFVGVTSNIKRRLFEQQSVYFVQNSFVSNRKMLKNGRSKNISNNCHDQVSLLAWILWNMSGPSWLVKLKKYIYLQKDLLHLFNLPSRLSYRSRL